MFVLQKNVQEISLQGSGPMTSCVVEMFKLQSLDQVDNI